MFRGVRHLKQTILWSSALLLTLSTSLSAINEDAAKKEIEAKNKLAEKLMKLSKEPTVKEARYPESQQGGSGQDFDRNTGNPFKSNTTYHSYVWDYCMQWQGPRNCQQWLDPYVSIHGVEGDADQSPLEGAMAKFWKQMKKPGETGANGSYGIWDIKAKTPGSVLDDQGRLDRERLSKMTLKREVAKVAEDIGYDTAQQQVNVSYNEDAPKNEMPNMESLRLFAGRYTRILRSEGGRNIGELGAAAKGIEFALGEDSKDCNMYLQWMQTEQEETKTEERLKPQGELDMETRVNDLKTRYEMCMKVRNAPMQMINPKVVDGKVVSGGKDTEQVDKWRSRALVAVIDNAGLDVRDIPKPSDAEITEEDIQAKVGEWNEGGMEMRIKKVTTEEQLNSYNQQLRAAAQGMKEVAARSPFFADASDQILENQIRAGEKSLVEINGLTKEMKLELKDTKMPRIGKDASPQQFNPDRDLEQAPSQLTFSIAQ